MTHAGVIDWAKRLQHWQKRQPSMASQVAESMYIHGHSQLVPRVAVRSHHNVSSPVLLRAPDPAIVTVCQPD